MITYLLISSAILCIISYILGSQDFDGNLFPMGLLFAISMVLFWGLFRGTYQFEKHTNAAYKAIGEEVIYDYNGIDRLGTIDTIYYMVNDSLLPFGAVTKR